MTSPGVLGGHVIVHQLLEPQGQLFVGPLKGREHLAVDEDGALGRLSRAGKADADVGGLGFARAVHDASHHGEGQGLHPHAAALPLGHHLPDVARDALRQLLERGAGRSPAAGAGRDARSECAQSEGLQELAGRVDLLAPVSTRARGQRDADGVADPLVQEDPHGGCGPDQALDPHARLREPQVEGLPGPGGQIPVEGDELLGPGGLAGEDDLVLPQPAGEGELRRLERGEHHALGDDLLGSLPQVPVRILLHLGNDELLVQRSRVDADAHRFALVHGDLADGGKLFVPARAVPHVARIDAVLVQSFGALGHLSQKEVAVVVEIADEGSLNPGIDHAPLDFGHGLGGLRHVHRDAHHLRARPGQLDTLRRRRDDVRRVGVGHGLHHDGGAAPDHHVSDPDSHRSLPLDCSHLVRSSKMPASERILTLRGRICSPVRVRARGPWRRAPARGFRRCGSRGSPRW